MRRKIGFGEGLEGEPVNQVLPDPLSGVAPDLAAAIRRARLEEAQRSDAVVEIRSADIARLELLHDAVRPILEQVPCHIDTFDAAVSHGDHPRLFIDMIGFVELARDNRGYRLVQDTRHGRIVMAEADDLEAAVDAVAAYIARRLVEREKAMAADTTQGPPARRPGPAAMALPEPRERTPMTQPSAAVPNKPRRRQALAATLRFIIQFLGTVTLLLILMGVGFLIYHAVRAWLAANFGFTPE